MDSRQNIALIGFSTTGKSTVARLLAGALGWFWTDTDQLIVAVAGRPIHAIFSHDGEPAFRRREAALLAAALAGQHTVIATGGGAVTIPDNRSRLRERAWIVALTAEPTTVLTRLKEAARVEPRPLLDAPDPLQRIHDLMAQRQASYTIADLVVPTDDKTPSEVSQMIFEWFGRRL